MNLRAWFSCIKRFIKPIGMKSIDMMERYDNPQFVTCRLRLCSAELYRAMIKNTIIYNHPALRHVKFRVKWNEGD